MKELAFMLLVLIHSFDQPFSEQFYTISQCNNLFHNIKSRFDDNFKINITKSDASYFDVQIDS